MKKPKDAAEIDRLLAIARAATPGPWGESTYGGTFVWADGQYWPKNPGHSGDFPLAEVVLEKDAVHIAAFSPSVVITLLEQLREALEK